MRAWKLHSYWTYSLGLLIVWTAIISINVAVHGEKAFFWFYIVGGFAIAWVGGTIARYVYPPPARWLSTPRSGQNTP
jgi:hypothetical protein